MQLNPLRKSAQPLFFTVTILLLFSWLLSGLFARPAFLIKHKVSVRAEHLPVRTGIDIEAIGVKLEWIGSLFGVALYFLSICFLFRYWRYCPRHQIKVANALLILIILLAVASIVWGFTGYLPPVKDQGLI